MYSKTYQKSDKSLNEFYLLEMSLECIKRFDLYVVIEFMSRVNRMLHPNNFSQWFQFVIYSFDHERSRSGQVRNRFERIRTGLKRTSFGIGLIQSTLNKFLAGELKFAVRQRYSFSCLME